MEVMCVAVVVFFAVAKWSALGVAYIALHGKRLYTIHAMCTYTVEYSRNCDIVAVGQHCSLEFAIVRIRSFFFIVIIIIIWFVSSSFPVIINTVST